MVPTTTLWLTGRCELFLGWQVLMACASIRGTEGNSTLKQASRATEPEKSPSLQRAPGLVLLTAQGFHWDGNQRGGTQISLTKGFCHVHGSFPFKIQLGSVAAPSKFMLSTLTGFVLTPLFSNAFLRLPHKSMFKFYCFWRAFLYSAIKVALMWSLQPCVKDTILFRWKTKYRENFISSSFTSKVVFAHRQNTSNTIC